MKIYAFAIDLTDDRIVKLIMPWNVISNHDPVIFEIAFEYRDTGIAAHSEVEVMLL